MNRSLNILAAGLLALTLTGSAIAQSTDSKSSGTKSTESASAEAQPRFQPCSPQRNPGNDCVLKTYFLNNTYEQQNANEILIALRNGLNASTRIFLVTSRRAIVVVAPPDVQEVAQKLISELDRPQKSWRLTFTLADSDNGKRIGVQHFSIILVGGQHTTLKQGNKVPIMTGPSGGNGPVQFQYLDTGMNFDLTLDDSPGGLRLRSKVEQSAVGNPSEYGNGSGPLAQEPVIQQTSLEGTSIITPGKPLTLGSVDVAGSTRHIDIEVVAEPVS